MLFNHCLQQLIKRTPELTELVNLLPDDCQLTDTWFLKYAECNSSKKYLILNILFCSNNFIKKPTAEEFELACENSLKYLVFHPENLLNRIHNGLSVRKEEISKAVGSLSGFSLFTPWKFILEHALWVHNKYPGNQEVKKYASEIVSNYKLSKERCVRFYAGVQRTQNMDLWFCDSEPRLLAYNTLQFLVEFIEHGKINPKAQDKLPAKILNQFNLYSRSVPQLLIKTDLLIMMLEGLLEVSELFSPNFMQGLVDERGSCLWPLTSIHAEIEKLISRLKGYFHVHTGDDRQYLELAGTYGTSLQFNLERKLNTDDIFKTYEHYYNRVDQEEYRKYLYITLLKGDKRLIAYHRYLCSETSAINMGERDIANIVRRITELEDKGMISSDRASENHYSQVLPSVAQFKLGLAEPLKKGTGIKGSTATKYKNGKRVNTLELIENILNTDPFEYWWLKFKEAHNLNSEDKKTAKLIWDELN